MSEKMNIENLEKVNGGYDYLHDLSLFTARRVCNVVHYDSTSCLTLRREPGGEIIPNVGWQNGDTIMVHQSFNSNGWLLACKNGIFGYVNADYVY